MTLRVANDYTAAIEGRRTCNPIGFYGPGSSPGQYGLRRQRRFVTTKNSDGSIGYYSGHVFRADSPYQSIADLRGKTLGYVDVELTSGFKAPNFFYPGGLPDRAAFQAAADNRSHDNAALALSAGTVDAALNWWNSEDDFKSHARSTRAC